MSFQTAVFESVHICILVSYCTNIYLFSGGGGVESEAYYPQWRRINQSIERHTVLNESLIKLIEGDEPIIMT